MKYNEEDKQENEPIANAPPTAIYKPLSAKHY